MLHAIVMAGGSGTRFWPKSRRNRPKQLLKLHGDRTMLQQTVDRISPLTPPERTWIITGDDQAEATRQQLPELPPGHVVGEPCPRDTAACVGLAALIAAHDDPDATLVVMPADHVIEPAASFLRTVEAAADEIEADPSALVTFGIAPTRPETGYGYIERGDRIAERNGVGVHRVLRFREKPERAQAEEFLASGRFVWNSGIFVWKARTILEQIRRLRPELWSGLERIAAALGTPERDGVIRAEYPGLQKVPIDKAVMEHAPNVKVLEVRYDWNDVGDWRALSTLMPRDDDGNAVQGPVKLVQTKDCIIVADEGRLIAALGVEDLVIVQSGGATLVARRDELDRLKALVEELGADGFGDLL